MARYPEAVFLHRGDGWGYGFFFANESDFERAADSFSKPILRSFQGEPVPNQPDPKDHLLLEAQFTIAAVKRAGNPAIFLGILRYVGVEQI